MAAEWQGGWIGNKYYGPDEVPPAADETITAVDWSLHTLGGKPILKMTCIGEKTYQIGEIVNADDFVWSEPSQIDWTFRGVIKDVRVTLPTFNSIGPMEVVQNIEIELLQHTADYKPKTVKKMAQSSAATNKAVAAAKAVLTEYESSSGQYVSELIKPDADERHGYLKKICVAEKISLVEAIQKYGSWDTPKLKAFAGQLPAQGFGGLLKELEDYGLSATDATVAAKSGLRKFQNPDIGITPMPKPGERKFHFDDE